MAPHAQKVRDSQTLWNLDASSGGADDQLQLIYRDLHVIGLRSRQDCA
jgi:hypothetical protein